MDSYIYVFFLNKKKVNKNSRQKKFKNFESKFKIPHSGPSLFKNLLNII